jgi:hypothetical protein
MSGARHRRKGTRLERETRHKALGVHAAGYPLSGANRFRGSGRDLDICALGANEAPLIAEVKARANGAGLATPEKMACEIRRAVPSARSARPSSLASLGPHPRRGAAMRIKRLRPVTLGAKRFPP